MNGKNWKNPHAFNAEANIFTRLKLVSLKSHILNGKVPEKVRDKIIQSIRKSRTYSSREKEIYAKL